MIDEFCAPIATYHGHFDGVCPMIEFQRAVWWIV